MDRVEQLEVLAGDHRHCGALELVALDHAVLERIASLDGDALLSLVLGEAIPIGLLLAHIGLHERFVGALLPCGVTRVAARADDLDHQRDQLYREEVERVWQLAGLAVDLDVVVERVDLELVHVERQIGDPLMLADLRYQLRLRLGRDGG